MTELRVGDELATGSIVTGVEAMGLRGRMTRVDTTERSLFLDSGEVVEIVERLSSPE